MTPQESFRVGELVRLCGYQKVYRVQEVSGEYPGPYDYALALPDGTQYWAWTQHDELELAPGGACSHSAADRLAGIGCEKCGQATKFGAMIKACTT